MTNYTKQSINIIKENVGNRRASYIRLLPFDEGQINKYFEINELDLTFDKVTDMGITKEEITKPLFLWMISFIYPTISELLKVIKFDFLFSSKIRKSLFYFHLFYHILRGKYIHLSENESEFYYIKEKKTLRKIALLKQIHTNELDMSTLDQEKSFVGLDNAKFDIESIISTYFILASNKEMVEFSHETFKEYLLAEDILEHLIKGEKQPNPLIFLKQSMHR